MNFSFAFGGGAIPQSGTFLFDLTPGDYAIEILDCDGAGFADVFYLNASTMQTAELVSVVDEALVAITVEVGPPAEISGTVLDQVGDGILNLTVELWLVDGVVPISLTVVALDGSFIFADLLGGEYTLHFVKTGDNAIDEWYGGGTNSSDSEAISLLPGEVVMIDTTFETPRIGRVSTALPTDTATNAAGCYEFFGSDGQLLDSHIGPLGASSALFTAVAGTEVKVRFRECGFVNDDRLYPYDWAGPTSESSFDDAATFAVIPYVTTEATLLSSTARRSSIQSAAWPAL